MVSSLGDLPKNRVKYLKPSEEAEKILQAIHTMWFSGSCHVWYVFSLKPSKRVPSKKGHTQI